MALKTKDEYVESLRRLRPKVYIAGKEVASIVDEPMFRSHINFVGAGYDFCQDPQVSETAIAFSPFLTNRVV